MLPTVTSGAGTPVLVGAVCASSTVQEAVHAVSQLLASKIHSRSTDSLDYKSPRSHPHCVLSPRSTVSASPSASHAAVNKAVHQAEGTPSDSPRSLSNSTPCSPRLASYLPHQPHVSIKSLLASPTQTLLSPRQFTSLSSAIATNPTSSTAAYDDTPPAQPSLADLVHPPDEVQITLAQLLHGTKDLFTLSELVAKKQSDLKPVEVYAALNAAAKLATGDQKMLSDNYRSLHHSVVNALAGAFIRLLPSTKLSTMAGSLWLLCALDYQFKGFETAAIKKRILAKQGSQDLSAQLQACSLRQHAMLASTLADLDVRGNSIWEPLAASALTRMAASSSSKTQQEQHQQQGEEEEQEEEEDRKYWASLIGHSIKSSSAQQPQQQIVLPSIPGDVLGYLAHGFARCGTPLPAFWSSLSAQMTSAGENDELKSWQPDDLARVAWGLATGQAQGGGSQVSEQAHAQVLVAIGQAVKGRLAQLTTRQLAEVALAFPSAAHSMPDIYSGIAKLALQQMAGMRAAELAAVCSALGKAGMHNSRFMEAAAQQLVASGGLEKLSSRALCELANAYAMLGHFDTVLFTNMQHLLEEQLSGMEGLALMADAAWAFAQCHKTSASDASLQPLFVMLAKHATAAMRREGFKVKRGQAPPHHQAVTRLAWAFASVGHDCPQLFAAVATYMSPGLRSLPAGELRSLGQSFAMLGYAGGERFTRAADGLERSSSRVAGGYVAGLAGATALCCHVAVSPVMALGLAAAVSEVLGAGAGSAAVLASAAQQFL